MSEIKKFEHDPTAVEREFYPDDILLHAKNMYLNYRPIKEISDTTGMKMSALKYHIRMHWKPERDLLKSELFQNLKDSKKHMFVDLAQAGLETISRSIKEINKSRENLTTSQLKELTSVISEIDKIIRLDDGDPTEIKEDTRPATRAEIIKRLKADPFADNDDLEEAIIVEPGEASEK